LLENSSYPGKAHFVGHCWMAQLPNVKGRRIPDRSKQRQDDRPKQLVAFKQSTNNAYVYGNLLRIDGAKLRQRRACVDLTPAEFCRPGLPLESHRGSGHACNNPLKTSRQK
jgi:hypothetical protein